MTVVTRIVSRDFERSQAVARAQIAAHHYGCFTMVSRPLKRLLDGLERRKLIVRGKREVQ